MSNPSRIENRATIVDLGEAYARMRSFTQEMFSEGNIQRETMLRYQDDLKVLIQQATNYKTSPLTAADL